MSGRSLKLSFRERNYLMSTFLSVLLAQRKLPLLSNPIMTRELLDAQEAKERMSMMLSGFGWRKASLMNVRCAHSTLNWKLWGQEDLQMDTVMIITNHSFEIACWNKSWEDDEPIFSIHWSFRVQKPNILVFGWPFVFIAVVLATIKNESFLCLCRQRLVISWNNGSG